MKKILQKHYEHKYSHENKQVVIESIRKTHIPTSRFEAAVKFFPRYFQGGNILELGAGNGNVSKKLLEIDTRISSYTVGDISLPRLEGMAKNLKDDRISILELDAENIPEDKYGQYDAIIMIALIEHLVDPLRAMQAIRRLLKPGGFVYIDTPNIAKYTRRIKLLLGRFPSTASKNEGLTTYSNEPVYLHDEGHLHYYTYRSLSRMLIERCNFSRVVKLGYHVGRPVLGKIIHHLLAWIWPEMFSELVILAYG
ncbi:MAG TPA: class I SAM-dependent methyltransferase [Phycisphaerae bacterium]|nr:class I SAM-dependent methyltransferase [Phycisphaerae bacterium]